METKQSETNTVQLGETCNYCTDESYYELDMSQRCYGCEYSPTKPASWFNSSSNYTHNPHLGVYTNHIPHEKDGTTCYWCNDTTQWDFDTSQTCYWCEYSPDKPASWFTANISYTHKEHDGKYVHKSHIKYYDPPQYDTVVTSMEQIHITEDTRLVGDINLPDENYKLYIDTSVNNQDIDILLEGNINVGNGGIFVNDNGGANQIRIFMTEGS